MYKKTQFKEILVKICIIFIQIKHKNSRVVFKIKEKNVKVLKFVSYKQTYSQKYQTFFKCKIQVNIL